METRERIINGCLELFYKYGTKSVSVDDISFHLGISKKTFYQHFENKDDVIKEIANEFLKRAKRFTNEILTENTDVLDKLIKIYKKTLSQFSTCNPRFIYDIKKYNPEIYNLFLEYSDTQLDNIITNLIKQGKDEGMFRKEIDEHIICKLHQNRMTAIIEGSVLPEKTITDPIFSDVIIMGLVGITTIEGHKKLENKLKELEK